MKLTNWNRLRFGDVSNVAKWSSPVATHELLALKMRLLQSWEVDQATRDVIDSAGMGHYFIHRTEHNIGQETHNSGAHMVNVVIRQSEKSGSAFPAVLAIATVNGCSTMAIAKMARPKIKL